MARLTEEQKKAAALDKFLREVRLNQPQIDWVSVSDGYRGVEALEPIPYCMKNYLPGDQFVCMKQIARAWETQHRVKIIQGGRLERGLVRLANRSVPVLWPWYDVPVNDHDWFCRAGVRVVTKSVIERFDLSALSQGTEFYCDYRSAKEIGFCVAETVFGEPTSGPAEAALVLFSPQ